MLEQAHIKINDIVASELRTMDYLARRARFMEKAPLQVLHQVLAIACATIGCC